MSPPPLSDLPWGEALSRAARLLPADDPDAVLFHEERENLRIELLAPDRPPLAIHTRARGAAARTATGRLTHCSHPSPEDLAALAAGVGAEPPRLPTRPERPFAAEDPMPSTLEVQPVLRRIVELAAQVQKVGAGIVTGITVVWVEFYQKVWVTRGALPACIDVRRGRRLRVDAISNGWARTASATAERVYRPDAPVVVDDIAEGLVRRLRQRLTAKPAPTGVHPIVFAAGTGGVVVHELVGHALEADTVLRGASFLGKADRPVAGDLVTVIDDPRRGRAAWRSDDEGEAPTPVALLREGRVTGSMHDLRSARAMKRSPTGHGRSASYAVGVRPRMGCTFLAPGPHDPNEVIESTRSGIHVRRLESAGTDPSIGVAFFRVTDADWIESGRLDAPLEPFLMRMRLPEALNSIDRIAGDLEFDRCIGSCVRDGQALATSVGAPTYRLRVATIIR